MEIKGIGKNNLQVLNVSRTFECGHFNQDKVHSLAHDVGVQIKISKNRTKICFRNAVIRRLLIFFSSNEHHLVAIFM